jgi:N-acetylneuraminate epimerase
MKFSALVALIALSCAGLAPADEMPPLPDAEGFAGMFAGVSDGKLLAGGGANFPDKKPWDGGVKAWSDIVFVLDKPGGKWAVAGKLPRKLGYGVSAPLAAGVLCIGGADADKHYSDCFLLEWTDGKLATRKFPALPKACGYAAGARLGDAVFVAGGSEKPDATTALKTFWTLDLTKPDADWKALDAWLGPGRILPIVAVHDGVFYLFSGAELTAGKDGKPARTYLRDAYGYTPDKGWKKLADLPRAAVAAPSPAPVVGGRLLVISGDDGTKVNFTPPAKHPGFPRDVLAYDPKADRWETTTAVAISRATAPVVEWNGRPVIVSGELRPGVRTPEVIKVVVGR